MKLMGLSSDPGGMILGWVSGITLPGGVVQLLAVTGDDSRAWHCQKCVKGSVFRERKLS